MLKRIMDPLFGVIKIDPDEAFIVKSPLFQRLRHITHLGLAHYVYPSATHSRFSHSLGVMHLASRIGDILNQKKGGLIDEEDMKNLRMAALLHDLGHFPYSHTLELSEDDNTIYKLPKYIKNGHEEFTTFLIDNSYIADFLDNHGFDRRFIQKLILRPKSLADKVFLHDIIHWELDADRLDYLLRDSYFTGVRYGFLDYQYLLENLDVADYNNKEILVINDKAIRAVENLLISRFSLYDRVYTHEIVTYFDFVLKRLFLNFTKCLIPNFILNKTDLIDIIKEMETAWDILEFNEAFLYQNLYKMYKVLKKNDNPTPHLKNIFYDLNTILLRRKNDEIFNESRVSNKTTNDWNLRLEKIGNIIADLESLPDFEELNIRLKIPKNIFTKYEHTNFSSFGFDFSELNEIKEQNLDTIIITDKFGEKERFFESKKTFFREIFNQKSIKVNVYIRKHDDSFKGKFEEHAKNQIIDALRE